MKNPAEEMFMLPDDDLIEDESGEATGRLAKVIPFRKKEHETNKSLFVGTATEASPDHPDRNEDTLYTDSKRGVFAVADGMGGVPAGDLASQATINELQPDTIADALADAEGTESIKRATLIAKVFSADRETPQQKSDVEVALASIIERMHRSVERVQTIKAIQENRERFEKAKHIFKETFKGDFDDANAQDVSRMNLLLQMIASTATVSKFWKDESGNRFVSVAQMGDSRMYRFRNGSLEPLTKDQSGVQALIEHGIISKQAETSETFTLEQLKPFADTDTRISMLVSQMEHDGKTEQTVKSIRNMTTAVGGKAILKKMFHIDVEPDVETYDVHEGDLYLLCSDGVHDNLTDAEISQTISHARTHGVNTMVAELMERTEQRMKGSDKNERTKADDITLQVIEA